MKKIISISLSIFLVVWAIALFSGGTRANAADITVFYTGNWVGSSQTDPNDNAFADANHIVGNWVITPGKIVSTGWFLSDATLTEWTPSAVIAFDFSITFTDVSESTDHSYISFSDSFIDSEGLEHSHTGRCYGMLKSSIGYTQMQCLTIVTLKGGPFSLDEQNVRRSTMKRENQIRP